MTTITRLYCTRLWVKLVAYWIETMLDENASNAGVISKAVELLDVNWIDFDAKRSAMRDLALSS